MASVCSLLGQLGLFAASTTAQADDSACHAPAYVSAATPACPRGTSLLSDDYPAQALTISDDIGGASFVIDVVEKVFQAQPSPAPLIFLNVRPDTLAKLKADLARQAWVTPQMLRNLRLVSATQQDEMGDTEDFYLAWQQDIAKGTFDPRSGLATPRFVSNYPMLGTLPKSFSHEMQSCGITTGAPTPNTSPKNGFSGGNFDLLAPGLCALGEATLTPTEWESYSKQMCGPGVRRIKVPTRWLTAGHVDEILKVIHLPTSDNSCRLLVELASPKKAFDLLRASPDAKAFDVTNDQISGVTGGVQGQPGLQRLCGTWQMHRRDPKAAARHGYKPDDRDADTNEQIITPLSSEQVEGDPLSDCTSMTNKDIADLVATDVQFREYNQLVQQQLDTFKADLLKQLSEQDPQCHVTMLDVPQFFTGNIVVKNGRHLLQDGGNESTGLSFFPNPENGVVIGQTLLMPEPHSTTFKSYLLQSLQGLGLKVQLVETLDLHAADGDLHCATQVFRYCRP